MEANEFNDLRWDFCNGIDAYREWQGCMRNSENEFFKNRPCTETGSWLGTTTPKLWSGTSTCVPPIIPVASLVKGCYLDYFQTSAKKIPDCECHSSCKACGYGTLDFVKGKADRCLSCDDPLYRVDKKDNLEFGLCRRYYDPSDTS
jgi:hypothetical protein